MTIDEILERHGLIPDDVIMPEDSGTIPIEKYALCPESSFSDYNGHDLCVNFIAYYPDPGVYLVKRKVSKKDAMTITATMDYRFGYDKLGRFAAWGRNFVLECE